MAIVKISQLEQAQSLADNDIIPIVSEGNTKSATVEQIVDHAATIIDYPTNNVSFNLLNDNKAIICKIGGISELNFIKSNSKIDALSSGDKAHFYINGGLKNPYNKFSDGTTMGDASGNVGNTGTGYAYINNGVLDYIENYNNTPITNGWVVSCYPPIRLKGTNYDFNNISAEVVQGLNNYVKTYIVNGFHNRLIMAQKTSGSPIELFIVFGNSITSVGADYELLNNIFSSYYTVVNLDGGGSVQLSYDGIDLITNQNMLDANRSVPTAFKFN